MSAGCVPNSEKGPILVLQTDISEERTQATEMLIDEDSYIMNVERSLAWFISSTLANHLRFVRSSRRDWVGCLRSDTQPLITNLTSSVLGEFGAAPALHNQNNS